MRFVARKEMLRWVGKYHCYLYRKKAIKYVLWYIFIVMQNLFAPDADIDLISAHGSFILCMLLISVYVNCINLKYKHLPNKII